MKRTRVAQFVKRLTGWHYADGGWIRRQPWVSMDEEIEIEEFKRRYPNAVTQWPAAPHGVIERRIGCYTVYAPMEAEVDPWPTK